MEIYLVFIQQNLLLNKNALNFTFNFLENNNKKIIFTEYLKNIKITIKKARDKIQLIFYVFNNHNYKNQYSEFN